MNEFEALFDNVAFVVNFIISLIILIIFLRLASNVGKLRKHITGNSTRDLNQKAEKAIFKGDKVTAIDAYMDMLFLVIQNSTNTEEERKAEVNPIVTALSNLRAHLSDESAEKVQKYMDDGNP